MKKLILIFLELLLFIIILIAFWKDDTRSLILSGVGMIINYLTLLTMKE